nr:SatD family protein [uncultured Sphaerochaeta sp.]
MDNTHHYVAIIADIIDSRTLPNRRQVQIQLQQVLKNVNNYSFLDTYTQLIQTAPFSHPLSKPKQRTTLKDTIVSPFTITLGDEFQGLLSDYSLAVPIVDYIERHMWPVRIRFGIGIGEIHTEIIRNSPFGMDGPAYHIARDMLIHLKQSEKKHKEPFTTMRIGIADNEKLSMMLNMTFSLLSTLKEGWTEKQQKTVHTFMEAGQYNQMQTAALLGITQPTVNNALSAAHFYTYLHTLAGILSSLNEEKR